MDWEAHSFLCISPDAVLTRHVQAIAGFSRGFTVTGEDIGVSQPAALDPQAWDSHLGLLRTGYPGGPSTPDIWVPDRRIGPASPQA